MFRSVFLKRVAQSIMIFAMPLAFANAQTPFQSIPDIPPPPAGTTPPPGVEAPVAPMTPPPPQGAPGVPSGWASPGVLGAPPSADWMNQGSFNVMATGYDSQGVMKQIPLNISYKFNGVNYDVVVNNAWNPYTENWNMDVDTPAYSTSYYMNGFTYNYYAMLPIGTFYFNL